MKTITKACVFLGLALSSSLATADEFKLGYTYLTKGIHDKVVKAVIDVKGHCKSVDAIKVKAHRKSYLTAVDLEYANGQSHTISFTRKIGMNEETKWRALPLKVERCVKKITVRGYSRADSVDRSGITVYGKK